MHWPPPLGALPKGLAFEIADLVMVQGWAEYHDLRMVVELDYCSEGDEYEEILALYPSDSSFRRWMVWRGATEIVVQPMMGRASRFASVAEALDHLIPARA
jgi:hypothetical protein